MAEAPIVLSWFRLLVHGLFLVAVGAIAITVIDAIARRYGINLPVPDRRQNGIDYLPALAIVMIAYSLFRRVFPLVPN